MRFRASFHHTVQVAGIASFAEARMLIDCGVDYLGFPLRLDVHREDIDADAARDIVARIGGRRAVVITYLDSAKDIRALVTHVGACVVQLHGPVDEAELVELRAAAPDITIIRSVIVRPGSTPDLGRLDETAADAYIVDTFDPATGASGATGQTHDWSVSRQVVESTARPVILAGGLNPENVARAIETVRPAAVDVHTGAEDPSGAKSRKRVQAFVDAAHPAFKSA